jgi:hypothetical protein
MAMRNIKMMVKDKVVRFKFYREGELFYETECGFAFPVPLSDVGNATFLAEDKALLFMRYIRKHLAVFAAAREESELVMQAGLPIRASVQAP